MQIEGTQQVLGDNLQELRQGIAQTGVLPRLFTLFLGPQNTKNHVQPFLMQAVSKCCFRFWALYGVGVLRFHDIFSTTMHPRIILTAGKEHRERCPNHVLKKIAIRTLFIGGTFAVLLEKAVAVPGSLQKILDFGELQNEVLLISGTTKSEPAANRHWNWNWQLPHL